jgi:hypothetical protein
MTRYYIKTYLSPYTSGRLEDKVKELHCLFWDHKRKVHTFVLISAGGAPPEFAEQETRLRQIEKMSDKEIR